MEQYTNVTSTATGRTDNKRDTTFRWLIVTPQPGNRGHTTLGLSVKVSGTISEDGTHYFNPQSGFEVYSRPPTKDYWLDNYGELPKVILVTTDVKLMGTSIKIWRAKPASKSLERLAMLRRNGADLPTNFTAWELAGHGPNTDYFMFERTSYTFNSDPRELDPTELAAKHLTPLYQQPHDAGLTQLSRPTKINLIQRGIHRFKSSESDVNYRLWTWDDAVAYETRQLNQYRNSKSAKSKLRNNDTGGSQ